MKLSPVKAAELITTPASKKQIESVRAQESQLRVFTEELDEAELLSEQYWTKLNAKLRTRSPKKYERVIQFARYPLPVVDITDSILSDFFKVFDGKNRNFRIDGDRDLTSLDKWIIDINLEKWIEDCGREVFKSKPCSFVVIDVDSQGKPYPILVDSNRLIDSIIDESGQCEYIIFLHSVAEGVTRVSVYDDEKYMVFAKQADATEYILEQGFPINHSIGYCPAKAFVSQSANSKNYFKRRVAFSNGLSKLEDWNNFDIYRNFMDHYVPFPVTEAPIKSCPNSDCTDGWINEPEVLDPSKPNQVTNKWHKCPICVENEGNQIYPGTHIGIKVQSDKTLNDASGIFRMIFPDTDKMEYTPNKLTELELDIRHKTVGLNYMASINEAVNKMQLSGSFASMESVLLRVKDELDIIYKWIVETAAKIYYKDIVIKVDANFGTEFYLISEDDLQKRFDNAKKMGLPQEELLMIYLQLIDTKYKGNPSKVERQKMLIQIEPLPFLDISEAMTLAAQNVIDKETLSLKVNFINFVSRFENENSSITKFGIKISPEARIQKILQVLKIYNTEAMAKIPPPTITPAQTGN